MIVYDLRCAAGHVFEAWFAGSEAFADQQGRGLVACPCCGDTDITKAVMAPRLNAGSGAAVPSSPDGSHALALLKAAQQAALAQSQWVGDGFAEAARAMHYGERDAAPIHGSTTLGEACALVDEGVPVAPLPFPVTPPPAKLN